MNTDTTQPAEEPTPNVAPAIRDLSIRIPIGSKLKMKGGAYFVTSGSDKSIVITGPVQALKVGEKIMLFGHLAEIICREVKTARLQLLTRGKFDLRPILQLVDDAPPPPPEQPEPFANCEGCGGIIISRLCSCGTAHPDFKPTTT